HVHLTDLVPSSLLVDSISPGPFNCAASTGQQVDCSLSHLAAGRTQILSVTYHVGTATESDPHVTNTASGSSDENTARNGDDSVAIVENVSLFVTKAFTDGAVDAGTTGHVFTITVKNTGVSEAD